MTKVDWVIVSVGTGLIVLIGLLGGTKAEPHRKPLTWEEKTDIRLLTIERRLTEIEERLKAIPVPVETYPGEDSGPYLLQPGVPYTTNDGTISTPKR